MNKALSDYNYKWSSYEKQSYICEKCGTRALHFLYRLIKFQSATVNPVTEIRKTATYLNSLEMCEVFTSSNYILNICYHCNHETLSHIGDFSQGNPFKATKVHPLQFQGSSPHPHDDMPLECLALYDEAARIFDASPRAAAAILRLCLEQLLSELGETKGRLYDRIESYAKKGIPDQIRSAFHKCRLLGNMGAHAAEINFEDNREIVIMLFSIINYLIDREISSTKKLEEFDTLVTALSESEKPKS